MFCRSLFVLLSNELSVLLRLTDSDYPFGIFKLLNTDGLIIVITSNFLEIGNCVPDFSIFSKFLECIYRHVYNYCYNIIPEQYNG